MAAEALRRVWLGPHGITQNVLECMEILSETKFTKISVQSRSRCLRCHMINWRLNSARPSQRVSYVLLMQMSNSQTLLIWRTRALQHVLTWFAIVAWMHGQTRDCLGASTLASLHLVTTKDIIFGERCCKGMPFSKCNYVYRFNFHEQTHEVENIQKYIRCHMIDRRLNSARLSQRVS